MGKTHHIAKSAIVPSTVQSQEKLVQANSRLSMISALSATVAGIPGVILLRLGGAPYSLIFSSALFIWAAFLGLQVPATTVATTTADDEERRELQGSRIVLASGAMGFVRAVVGFVTLLLAFELRTYDPGPQGAGVEIGHRVREALGLERLDLTSGGAPAWYFGAVLVATGCGGLAGAALSPRLRERFSEERILLGLLVALAAAASLSFIAGSVFGAALVAATTAIVGQTGRQSFDAIVQRDAPEANLGRSFSRFESRFQMLWVIGALIPVIISIPARIGYLILAVLSGLAALSYGAGKAPLPSQVPRSLRVSAPGRKRRTTKKRTPPSSSSSDQ